MSSRLGLHNDFLTPCTTKTHKVLDIRDNVPALKQTSSLPGIGPASTRAGVARHLGKSTFMRTQLEKPMLSTLGSNEWHMQSLKIIEQQCREANVKEAIQTPKLKRGLGRHSTMGFNT